MTLHMDKMQLDFGLFLHVFFTNVSNAIYICYAGVLKSVITLLHSFMLVVTSS